MGGVFVGVILEVQNFKLSISGLIFVINFIFLKELKHNKSTARNNYIYTLV